MVSHQNQDGDRVQRVVTSLQSTDRHAEVRTVTRRESGTWHLQATVPASPGFCVSAHSQALGGPQGRYLVTRDGPTQTRSSVNVYKQTSTHTISLLFWAGRNRGIATSRHVGVGPGRRAGLPCLPNVLAPCICWDSHGHTQDSKVRDLRGQWLSEEQEARGRHRGPRQRCHCELGTPCSGCGGPSGWGHWPPWDPVT